MSARLIDRRLLIVTVPATVPRLAVRARYCGDSNDDDDADDEDDDDDGVEGRFSTQYNAFC